MSGPDQRIPVTLLTGFLGSGKTTVLNRWLKQPALAGAAVIINEFGEIGLDHLLIEASEEQFTLLDNGCVCCTVRGDLIATLKTLDARSLSGEIAPLTHVLIETTGLADPAPVLHSLMAEQELVRRFRIAGVVTTVDAVNGAATLNRHAEAAKQVAVADRLLITKTDLATPQAVAGLDARLAQLAPLAERMQARHGAADADLAGLLMPSGPGDRLPNLLSQLGSSQDDDCGPGCAHDHHGHGHAHHGIASYGFTTDQPVELNAFLQWLDYLTALKGEDLLRMKGLICVAGDTERPLVVHGVQHVFHPPVRLDGWPGADRSTRIIFIVRGIARETIERTLARFAGVSPRTDGRSMKPAA